MALIDQGLGFDLSTVLGRRQLLRGLGPAASAVGLAAEPVTGQATGA